MPITIIEAEEQLTCKIGTAEFTYRRCGVLEQGEITRRCRDAQGQTDFFKISVETVKDCLLGWSNGAVYDGKGQPLTFHKDLAGRLPGSVINVLNSHILGATTEDEAVVGAALKNSATG